MDIRPIKSKRTQAPIFIFKYIIYLIIILLVISMSPIEPTLILFAIVVVWMACRLYISRNSEEYIFLKDYLKGSTKSSFPDFINNITKYLIRIDFPCFAITFIFLVIPAVTGSHLIALYHYEEQSKDCEIFFDEINNKYYISEKVCYTPTRNAHKYIYNKFFKKLSSGDKVYHLSIFDSDGREIGFNNGNSITLDKMELIKLHKDRKNIYVIKNKSISNVDDHVSLIQNGLEIVVMTKDYPIHNYHGKFVYNFDESGFWDFNVIRNRNHNIEIIPDQSQILNQNVSVLFTISKIDSRDNFSFLLSPIHYENSTGRIFVGDIECKDPCVLVGEKRFSFINPKNGSILLEFVSSLDDGCLPTTYPLYSNIKYTKGYRFYKLPDYSLVNATNYETDYVEFSIPIDNRTVHQQFILADLTKPVFNDTSLPRYYNKSHKEGHDLLLIDVRDDVGLEGIYYKLSGDIYMSRQKINNLNTFQNEMSNIMHDGHYIINFDAIDKAGNVNGTKGEWAWEFDVDTKSPKIRSKFPEGIVELPIDCINVEFNEPMDRSSLYMNAFAIKDENESLLECEVPYWTNNKIVNFKINSFIKPDARYTVTVSTKARDIAGNNLESDNDNTWTFRTEPVEPYPPVLRVISAYPVNNSRNISIATSLCVKFSEIMNLPSLNNSLILRDETDQIIPCPHESTDDRIICFKPDQDLAYNSSYKATVTTNAKDLDGNNLGSDYTWTFETAPEKDSHPMVYSTTPEESSLNLTTNAKDLGGNDSGSDYTRIFETVPEENSHPVVLSTTPENSSLNIPTTTTICIEFSEIMDLDSLVNALFLRSENDQTVTCKYEYSTDNRKISFKPDRDLECNTKYVAKVTINAKDLDGKSLESNYSWVFDTIYIPNPVISYPEEITGLEIEKGDIECVKDVDGKCLNLISRPDNNILKCKFNEDDILNSYNRFDLNMLCKMPECESRYFPMISMYIYNNSDHDTNPYDYIGDIYGDGKINPRLSNAGCVCVGCGDYCIGSDLNDYVVDNSIQLKFEINHQQVPRTANIEIDQFNVKWIRSLDCP